MADKNFKIAVILEAIDKMSASIAEGVAKSQKYLDSFQKKNEAISRAAFTTARNSAAISAAILVPLGKAVSTFADFEAAENRLKSTMLEAGGQLNKNFEATNKLAVTLGAELKGNTADFEQMFGVMYSGGVSAESILNGVGRSAAYMGNVLDINYNTAASFASKIKQATGVDDSQMMGMLDTLTRITQVMPGGDNATKATELEQAFARSGGQLKNFGLQGLEASKQVATLYAELIRSGAQGETVGTGFSKILESFYNTKQMKNFNAEAAQLGLQFDFIDKKTGDFKGVENMVEQFDKMKGLTTLQRTNLITALVGDGQDSNFIKTFANLGVQGYNEMTKQINRQATLEQRQKIIAGGLANAWETSMGNFDNTMADLGKTLKPTLIHLIDNLNDFFTRVNAFMKEHPGLTTQIAKWTLGLGTAFAAISAAAITVGGIASGMATIAKILKPLIGLLGGGTAAATTGGLTTGAEAVGGGTLAALAAAKAPWATRILSSLKGAIPTYLLTHGGDMSSSSVSSMGKNGEYIDPYHTEVNEKYEKIMDANHYAQRQSASLSQMNGYVDQRKNGIAGGSSTISPVQITYAPTLHVGKDTDAKSFLDELKNQQKEIMKIVDEGMRRRNRVAFN